MREDEDGTSFIIFNTTSRIKMFVLFLYVALFVT